MAKYQSKHTGAQIDSGIDKISILETQANSMNEKINTIENSMITDVYTKEESDAKYTLKDDVYTKEEADLKYVLKDETYTKEEADAKYATNETVGELEGDIQELGNRIDNIQPSETVDAYTKEESDAKYASKATENQTNTNKDNITNLTTKVTTIESGYIKSVVYDTGAGIFTFTLQDGSVESVDLAIEKFSEMVAYNDETKSIELMLTDGTIQSIPLSDFINDYNGVENDQIQVLVESGNKIQAILKDGSIKINHLDSKFANDINTVFTTVGELSNDVQDNTEAIADRYTKQETSDLIDAKIGDADLKYVLKDEAYTKEESDSKYASKQNIEEINDNIQGLDTRITNLEENPSGSSIDAYTKEEADNKFAAKDYSYSKNEAYSMFASQAVMDEISSEVQVLNNRVTALEQNPGGNGVTEERVQEMINDALLSAITGEV